MSACWHRNVVCWFFISCVISNVVIFHDPTGWNYSRIYWSYLSKFVKFVGVWNLQHTTFRFHCRPWCWVSPCKCLYVLQLASLPITFRAVILGIAMTHLSVVLIVEVWLPANNNLRLMMVKTNRSTLHTLYNIQQSATQSSNDTTHRLSRRTTATTRFS